MNDTIDLMPNCANCRFSVMVSPEQGTCNRYAPRPSHATQGEVWAEWPLVMPNDWCGEWTLPATDDELFADYLARNAETLPSFDGIAVLPTTPPSAEPATRLPDFFTYDEPFEDPIR